MPQGYFSRRFRRTRNELEVHFFEPQLLDQYRNHPWYDVRERSLGTKDRAPIGPSTLQQYVWGRTAIGEPCIAAILAHLCTLSAKDQDNWHHHELCDDESRTAKIHARYARPMIHGQFPDAMSAYDAIFLYVRDIATIFGSTVLFPNFEGTRPDFLAPLAHNSRKDMARFAQDLHTFLTPSMETLASRITSDERKSLAAKLRSEGQSRNLLKLYFEEHGVMSADVEAGIQAIAEFNEWRVKSAHKLVPATADQDYRTLQAELVSQMQRGLRAMLIGFQTAEKATHTSYRSYVLSLTVE